MLLNCDAWRHPQFVELTDTECWLFIRAFCYSSEWNLPTLTRSLQRFNGVTPKVARRFVKVGLARLEDDGGLTWDCYDLARFTPRREDGRPHVDRGPGFTYLIQAGETGHVKIGSTYKDPEDRLRALQTGNHEPLRLVKVLNGAHLERELHEKYDAFRVQGEWFDGRILDVLQ